MTRDRTYMVSVYDVVHCGRPCLLHQICNCKSNPSHRREFSGTQNRIGQDYQSMTRDETAQTLGATYEASQSSELSEKFEVLSVYVGMSCTSDPASEWHKLC